MENVEIEVDAFDQFWSLVKRFEQAVRENRSCPTPINYGDPLDEEDKQFLDAYEKISPYLIKFHPKKHYFPPAGLILRSGPYLAETAHQALLYFLLHPADYESSGVLDSSEYRSITEEAQEELKSRQIGRQESPGQKTRSVGKQAAHERNLAKLLDVIKGHILAVKDEEDPEALDWRGFQDRLQEDENGKPWSQSKISRLLAALFNAEGAKGLTAYREIFRDRRLREGLISKSVDGVSNVDAAVNDPPPAD